MTRTLRTILLCCCLAAAGAGEAADGTILIELRGGLALRPELTFLGRSREISLHQACELLRRAFRAEEKTVALDLTGGFVPGLAAAEELAAVLKTRPEGKRVVCLIDHVDDAALIVTAACDEVTAAEAGLLAINGLLIEIDHFAGALDKIGVKFHAVTSGPQKTGPEPLTRSEPSAVAREEYAKLLAAVDRVLVAGSLRGELDEKKLRAARAAAPQPGPVAKELGLVDRVAECGAWAEALPEPLRRLDTKRDMPDPSTLTGMLALWTELLYGPVEPRLPEVVAVVELEGTIYEGGGGTPGSAITGTDTAEMLGRLGEDGRVKAVVVRINSGGGSATASDRMYHALERLDAAKPVVALFDGVAASGGYYVGCGAREILVHRGTITGSIGVFGLLPDIAGAWEKLGIKTFSLKTDPRADLFSLGACTDEKRAAVAQAVAAIDARFQAVVAAARGLEPAKVAELADGKVYLGERAIELGLADGLGNLAEAVVRARTLAGIDQPLPVELYPKPQGLAELLSLFQVRVDSLIPVVDLPPFIRSVINDLHWRRPLVETWTPVPRIR